MNLDKYFNDFEEVSNIKLPSESIIAIRVDGKNFKNFTKTLDKPFDDCFASCMQVAMIETAKTIQGCFYGFTQSDEITFLLTNNIEQTPYYNNRIQKISSIVASEVTLQFYKTFLSFTMQYQDAIEVNRENLTEDDVTKMENRLKNLWEALKKNPVFDARCFAIPYNSLHNLVYNRQQHNYNNAIQGIAQANSIESQGLKLDELINIMGESKIDIHSFKDEYLYGVEVIKVNEKWQLNVASKLEFEEME